MTMDTSSHSEIEPSPIHQSMKAVASYRSVVAAIYILVALSAAISMRLSMDEIDADIANVARERGSVLFRLIEMTRDWSSGHGGVYVPVTEATQPNPYLLHPKRDITDNHGRALTLINPAFMTRQIAEIAEKAEGVRFHITSIKPIRPANKADAWETETLTLFEKTGLKDRLVFFGDGGGGLSGPTHRYMAPLMVKPPCMKCHEVQGYKVGDIRGGISVSMPAEALVVIGQQRRKQMAALYLLGFVIVAGLGHLVAWRTRRYLLALQDINRRQEVVIAARTHDLSAANAALEKEIAEVAASHHSLQDSQARYRAVIERSQNGIVVIEDGRTTIVNMRMAEIIAYQPEELRAMSLSSWVAPEDREWFDERYQRLLAGESVPGEFRLRLLHRDGVTRKHVDVQASATKNDRGGVTFLASIRDMTEKLEAEKERSIAAAVFGNAAEGIMVTDKDNAIIRVNPAFSAITGYTPAEVLGKQPSILNSGRHDTAFFEEMWRHLDEVGRWEGEIWNRRKNGEIFVEWLAITTVEGDAGEGRHVATFNDITKRKEADEIILHRANFDVLTDLPNRGLFDDRLVSVLAMARRHHRNFALMYIDIDWFKGVNDSLGHAAGDVLLAEAAKRMEKCVRDADTVARLGGDEFAVILSDLNGPGEVEDVARRVNRALAEPFDLPEGVTTVSGSIGIAIFPGDGADELLLKKAADRALYAAKSAGRNTYRMATSSC
jgi:diguanylate cyclase (GGDEF)-like protein/PAS domain S-box-containing protein